MFKGIHIELEAWLCSCGGDHYEWGIVTNSTNNGWENSSKPPSILMMLSCSKCKMVFTIPIDKVNVSYSLDGCPPKLSPAKISKIHLASGSLEDDFPETVADVIALSHYAVGTESSSSDDDIPF